MSQLDFFGRIAAHQSKLQARLVEMQEQVFISPPRSMEEFSRRLGAWIELNNEIKDLKAAFRGSEDEDEPA